MIEKESFQRDEIDQNLFSYSQSMVDAIKPMVLSELKNRTRQSIKLFIFITILLIILSGLTSLLILHFFPNLTLGVEIFIDLVLLMLVIVPLFIIFAYQPILKYFYQERKTQVFLEQTNAKIQKLEFVLEKSPTIIYICLLSDGLPIKCISKNVNHFGYSAEDLVNTGSCFSTLIHPDDVDHLLDEIYASIAAGFDEFKNEFRVITKDGSFRWVIAYNSISRNSSGESTNLQGVMLDVTHRIKSIEESRQTKLMVESIFTLTNILRARLDQNLNFITVNDAFSKFVGKPNDFFHGKHFFDIFPDIDFRDQFHKVLRGSEMFLIQEQKISESQHEESTAKYWDCIIQPIKHIFDEENEILLSLIDVTEQALAKKEIELERNNLKQILNSMHDGVYIVNGNYDIEFVNRAIEQDYGQVNHQKCYRYFHSTNEPCSFCRLPPIKRREVLKYEQKIARTGKIYNVLDIPLENPDSSISKLKVMHDITKLKSDEERLKLLTHHQTRILEDERQYIARELHDEVGQIISGLVVNMQLIETQVDDRDYVLRKVQEINRLLGNVSDNLHNIAMSLRPASLDHLGLVAAIQQYVDALKGMSQVNIVVNNHGLHQRLPNNIETMIYRIVQEALTNVIRHAHATKAEIILKITGHKLIVSIEDNGIGFDPNIPPTPSHIGLLGMQERVQLFNGKMKIESSHNQGTKIILEVDCENPDSGCG